MTETYFVGRQNKKSRRAAKQRTAAKSSPQGKYFIETKEFHFVGRKPSMMLPEMAPAQTKSLSNGC